MTSEIMTYGRMLLSLSMKMNRSVAANILDYQALTVNCIINDPNRKQRTRKRNLFDLFLYRYKNGPENVRHWKSLDGTCFTSVPTCWVVVGMAKTDFILWSRGSKFHPKKAKETNGGQGRLRQWIFGGGRMISDVIRFIIS